MQLNDNQKKFLFENYYVTSKTLDSLTYEGWENYWIKNFDFELDSYLNNWNMRTLKITDKENPKYFIEVELNFQENDFDTLLEIE